MKMRLRHRSSFVSPASDLPVLRLGFRPFIFVPVVLGMLGLLNVLFHVWALQGRADLALRSADAAVGLLVTLVTIIAGRVTPMFTANAVCAPILVLSDTSTNGRQGRLKRNDVRAK